MPVGSVVLSSAGGFVSHQMSTPRSKELKCFILEATNLFRKNKNDQKYKLDLQL
jgi:hypothetical protein